jgi:hypothetical protein
MLPMLDDHLSINMRWGLCQELYKLLTHIKILGVVIVTFDWYNKLIFAFKTKFLQYLC